jgi:hypothetical protein
MSSDQPPGVTARHNSPDLSRRRISRRQVVALVVVALTVVFVVQNRDIVNEHLFTVVGSPLWYPQPSRTQPQTAGARPGEGADSGRPGHP